MRIIAGEFGRRIIEAPPGRDTRPTTDRVRESIFSLVAARTALAGANVLDLFAGSGALGLEAVSRGAQQATFVEKHGRTLGVARRNAAALGVTDRTLFVRADVLTWLAKSSATFDLVLADPPYELPALPDLPGLILPRLTASGWLVLEHDTWHSFDQAAGFESSRTYGSTVVSLFQSG